MSNGIAANDFASAVEKYRILRRPYRWRGFFYIPPLLVMPFCVWNEYENDFVIWPMGLLTVAMGLFIRIWATRHIERRIPRRYKGNKGPRLVATGPYSIVRNPLYLGNLVIMMGLCILSELLWLMPIVFAYLLSLFSLVVRYEEYKLSILFGREYEIYRQDVPRWIPRFSLIRSANNSDSAWSQALTGELQSIGPASLMILILLIKEIVGP